MSPSNLFRGRLAPATAAALAAFAVLAAAPAPARAQGFVTACHLVTLNGNNYIRYDFSVYNPTTQFTATGIQLVQPVQGFPPGDTCSVVALGSPVGWQPAAPGVTLWLADPNDPAAVLAPGQLLAGFSIVTTRDCCWEVILHNLLAWDDPDVGVLCLTCPDPARGTTWGAVKAVYR